jgi:hypothetical protein
MCAKSATDGEGAAWVSTRNLPARSGSMWGHSRSNVLNVGLRPALPAANRRGKASTTHTRLAESVRTLKPWPWPTPPRADRNTPVHSHKTQDRRIRLPASSCTTPTCRSPCRGVKGLRSHPRSSQERSMQDPASELRRISLLRGWMNSGCPDPDRPRTRSCEQASSE